MSGILREEYNRGYRDGFGQASQVNHDEAYIKGQEDAYADEPSRFRWFALGAIAATVIGYFL